jgi:hypothetical protein
MSWFQHLPLFQRCYSFSKEIYCLKLQLPKNLKHDLGSDLFTPSLRSTKLVILANGSESKEKPLKELFLEVQVTWVWLRLLVDLEAISAGQFKELSERTAEIEEQISSWLTWDKKQRKAVVQPSSASPRNSKS